MPHDMLPLTNLEQMFPVPGDMLAPALREGDMAIVKPVTDYTQPGIYLLVADGEVVFCHAALDECGNVVIHLGNIEGRECGAPIPRADFARAVEWRVTEVYSRVRPRNRRGFREDAERCPL